MLEEKNDFDHFSAMKQRSCTEHRIEIDIFIHLEEDAIEQLRLVQNELNAQGASDLVVELLISQSSSHILEESIHLAIALLEGGNSEVQVQRSIRSMKHR